MPSKVVVVAERLVALPGGDLAVPLGQVGRRLDDLVQLAQGVLHVADDRQIGLLDLVDLRGVDVDVDDLRPAGELRDLAGHAIVEPHAQGQQQIGVVDRVVGVDAAVHAEHVQRERIVAGEAAQAHQRRGHGNARLADQRGQFVAGVGGDDAAAGVDHRPLGGADQRGHRRRSPRAWPAVRPTR